MPTALKLNTNLAEISPQMAPWTELLESTRSENPAGETKDFLLGFPTRFDPLSFAR